MCSDMGLLPLEVGALDSVPTRFAAKRGVWRVSGLGTLGVWWKRAKAPNHSRPCRLDLGVRLMV